MKRIKLASYATGLDPVQLGVFSANVLEKLKNNVHLPNTHSLQIQLAAAHNDLVNVANAATTDNMAIKRKVLQVQKILNALRAQIELDCNDDEAIAASSGFAIVQHVSHPRQSFVVKQGELSGTVKLRCAYAGVRAAYIWEIADDPLDPGLWTIIGVTTKTTTNHSGLVPGNKYWFRVQAIVNNERSAFSEPFRIHVIEH